MFLAPNRVRIRAYHEVTLDKVQLLGEAFLHSIVSSTINLVVVVVEAGDVSAGKFGNLTSRTTDTAANIEDLHALLNAYRVRKVVLMASDGLAEGFVVGEAAKVEALAPTILVEVGC